MGPSPVYDTAIFINETFPEHHWPLEHTRQKAGHALKDLLHPYNAGPLTPRADVRETMKNCYIDIELPGLRSKENLTLKWVNSQTLLVDADINRSSIPEDQQVKAATELKDAANKPAKNAQGKPVNSEEEHAVHILAHERQIGHFARSFNFTCSIIQESLSAKLSCGLLSIVVEKQPHEQKQQKTIKVQHTDS